MSHPLSYRIASASIVAALTLLGAFAVASCSGTVTSDGGLDARHDSFSDSQGDSPRADVYGHLCGNGRLEATEACDDSNTMSGDGCTADCTAVEPNYVCAVAGMPCVPLIVCGDGAIGAGEQCDDRNTAAGDGCDAHCQLEPGWTCPTAGVACRAAACGDHLVVDTEECDDGNTMSGDGCSATCILENGWTCPAGMPCRHTTCGDRIVEGTEQCDDGNTVLGDGCDPYCHREPQCTDGTCMSTCGDGVRLGGEACDDGNTRPNDGCSSTCQIERGYVCMDVSMEPASLDVPIVYRDFRGHDLPGGHIDFENVIGTDPGIVATNLVSERPVYARGASGTSPTTHGQMYFDQWYTDVPGTNRTVVDRLTLTRTAAATYVFDDNNFFPLDGRGWTADGMEPLRTGGHNFSFTSELRYWFQYAGGEQLNFRGDDDVWVFINGFLAVDLGGVHGALSGGITLDAAAATRFSLRAGGIYEAVVFQAERHTTQSSYQLTLVGFNAPRSTCHSVCGDGILTRDEVCDDGVNDGSYGGCAPGCLMLGPHCGDHTVQADHGEQCDDGNNVSGDGCSATCRDEGIG